MGPATLYNSYNQRSEWRSDMQSEVELRQSWIIDFSFIRNGGAEKEANSMQADLTSMCSYQDSPHHPKK